MMISKRLLAVAGLVTKGYVVADIGTDHGYVPIYLVKNNICPKAYAMDINEGPLKTAAENVAGEGLQEKITVCLADGMEALRPEQADSVIIAGMGGELIVQILRKSKVNDFVKEFILSPHKNPEVLRSYLSQNHFCVTDEVMLKEGGKYYTVMKVRHGTERPYDTAELLYGRKLIEHRDLVLMEYLKEQERKFSQIYANAQLSHSRQTGKISEKLQNIRNTMEKLQNM